MTDGNPQSSGLDKARLILHRAEDSVLVGMLLFMIGMAFFQIVLRNTAGNAISWGDKLVRVLVLWIGLFGALVATRRDEHINVDLVARYLSGRAKIAANGVVHLFAAAVCSVVGYHSVRFVHMEAQYGGEAFAGIPFWVLEAVIPFAFCLMALRYALMFCGDLASLWRGVP
ncbi:MAG: TRAP transporter small permease [Desulfatibacillaceae bacterium]